MATAYTKADGMGIYLSGGASNLDPSDSLGGVLSSRLVHGMGIIYTTPVQALKIEDVSPDNAEGTGSIAISGNNAIYTPPGGSAGATVAITAGNRAILPGNDPLKYVRVYRVADETWEGTASFELVDMLNGVFSMGNISDADRQAGEVFYRAVFIVAHEDVQDCRAWITTDGQSSWALASEVSVADEIQTIADEETAPAAVSWVAATSQAAALGLGNFAEDDNIGVWIRRTFPALGTVATEETVNFHLEFKGV